MFFESTMKCQIFDNSSVRTELVYVGKQTIGWTDGHDEAYNRFSQCCE